jgi:type IV pilus assembly protein PilN
MIRINLLPIKETERALGRRQQMSLVALGLVTTLLIMLIPYLIQGRRISTLDGRVETLTKEIQAMNLQVREVRDIDRLKKEVQTKLQIIEDLNRKRVGPSRVLDDLSLASPENLWLIDFNEVGSAATFTGLALDNETIAKFMRQLQASPYFFSVDLVETSQQQPADPSKAAAAPQFTRFIVKATIDYFGRGGKPPEPPADGKTKAAPPPGQTAKQEPQA